MDRRIEWRRPGAEVDVVEMWKKLKTLVVKARARLKMGYGYVKGCFSDMIFHFISFSFRFRCEVGEVMMLDR